MNIVLITPQLNVGGGQRYVSGLANHWAEIGHNVFIFILWHDKIFYEISPNVKIIELGFHYSGSYEKITHAIRTGVKFRREIKKIKPAFILSISSTTNVFIILASFFLNTKLIVRDVYSPAVRRKNIESLSRKYLYKYADGVIAQTEEIKESVEKDTGNRNVRVIQNPVRSFHVDEGMQREKIVLNVAALTTRKGQRYFIEACSRINSPEWKFVILGEGELKSKLEKQIKDLGVQDKVQLMGSVKNIDEWLLKSSIFVFPSALEGLPNSLIEAMSAGLACVSFDCETGPRDLINDGENGFLVPVHDIDLLTSRVEELMNNEELRKKFSKEAMKSTKKLHISYISKEVLDFCTKF